MRISSLKLHSIAIADPPLRSSYGLHAPWALRSIIEIQTDDGITGISERTAAMLHVLLSKLLGNT